MQSSFPMSSFQILVLYTERKLDLTEEQFDEHFDAVLSALEKANNEKFRLQGGQKEVP